MSPPQSSSPIAEISSFLWYLDDELGKYPSDKAEELITKCLAWGAKAYQLVNSEGKTKEAALVVPTRTGKARIEHIIGDPGECDENAMFVLIAMYAKESDGPIDRESFIDFLKENYPRVEYAIWAFRDSDRVAKVKIG